MIAAAAMTASVAAGATTTVTYDASDPQTSYAGGAVTVTYDGSDAITAISATPSSADGGIDFTGSAMSLSSAETLVSLDSLGTLTFSNALNASGADLETPASLTVQSTLSWTGTATMERPSSTSTLLAPGVSLAALTNLTARFSGTVSGVPCNATMCFLSNNGSVATCQFQAKTSSSTLRAISLKLTQGADGVSVVVVGYGHISYSGLEENVGDVLIDSNTKNLEQYSGKATWQTGTRNDCYVTDLVMTYDLDINAQNIQPKVSLAAENSLENVDMVIGATGPVCVEIAHQEAFPESGSVTVSNNCKLSIIAHRTGVLDGVDNEVPITVRKGGTLEAKTSYAFKATGARFLLDGGTLAIRTSNNYNRDSSVYVHDITFKDGANISGERFRVRANKTTWTVEGTSSSYCESGIYVWTESAKTASNFKYSQFTINVADVAEGVDFFMTGPVNLPSDFNNYGYATLIKAGVGTMSIGAPFAMTNMPTRITDGTFLVDGDWLHSQCPFTLAGGIFAVPAGSTNTCGTLEVESASVLSVADGASLAFADSSALAWGGTLTLDADLSACTVRFGTGKTGLATSQRRKITTAAGGRVRLDDSGRLYPAPICFTISFR